MRHTDKVDKKRSKAVSTFCFQGKQRIRFSCSNQLVENGCHGQGHEQTIIIFLISRKVLKSGVLGSVSQCMHIDTIEINNHKTIDNSKM